MSAAISSRSITVAWVRLTVVYHYHHHLGPYCRYPFPNQVPQSASVAQKRHDQAGIKRAAASARSPAHGMHLYPTLPHSEPIYAHSEDDGVVSARCSSLPYTNNGQERTDCLSDRFAPVSFSRLRLVLLRASITGQVSLRRGIVSPRHGANSLTCWKRQHEPKQN